MKKYINLRTIMSFMYLVTFITLAVFMIGFPQVLSGEPTMLGGVLCGTNIGMAMVLFVDAVRSSNDKK